VSSNSVLRDAIRRAVLAGSESFQARGGGIGGAIGSFLDSVLTDTNGLHLPQISSASAPNASALLPDGYYRIIPVFEGGATLPGHPSVSRNGAEPELSFESRCFADTKVRISNVDSLNKTLELQIEGEGPA